MTAQELINELIKLPKDTLVMVRGYEGGYCDCSTPEQRRIQLNVHSAWYYGPHDDPTGQSGNPIVEAAIL